MAITGIVTLCMSCNYVIVRHRRDVGMEPALALAGVFSALIALPFAHPGNVSLAHLPWLLALGPGQMAIGLLLYMACLKRIPAGRAALLGLLELVAGPIWVWIVDGERPGTSHCWAGRWSLAPQRPMSGWIHAVPLVKNRT